MRSWPLPAPSATATCFINPCCCGAGSTDEFFSWSHGAVIVGGSGLVGVEAHGPGAQGQGTPSVTLFSGGGYTVWQGHWPRGVDRSVVGVDPCAPCPRHALSKQPGAHRALCDKAILDSF